MTHDSFKSNDQFDPPMTAAEAIAFLHRKADPTYYISCRTFGGVNKKPSCFQLSALSNPQDIEAFIAANCAQNIGLNVGLIRQPLPDAPSAEDIDLISHVFVDIDLASESKPNRPATKEEAKRFLLEDLNVQPSLIVDSGGGLHAFFVLSEPIAVNTPEGRAQAERCISRVRAHVNSVANAKHGWLHFDNVSDLARIHRLPGSTNWKEGEGRPCTVLWSADALLSVADIEALATSTPVSDPTISMISKRTVMQRGEASQTDKLLRDIDAAYRSKRRTPSSEQPQVSSNPAAIATGCSFVRYALDKPAALSEPEWHAFISAISAAERGDEVALEGSKGYPGFDPDEANAKITKSKKSGPAGCDYISTLHPGCNGCPFRNQIKSPIDLGRGRTADDVFLLSTTAYVAASDTFVDLHADRDKGLKAEQFRNLHGHLRLSLDPHKVIVKDEIAIKVKRTTFRPDLPSPLCHDEQGALLLNTYVPPVHQLEAGSADWFFEHLDYLIPKSEERQVFIQYLASLVQRPARKIQYAVAIVGPQGTGKTFLLQLMARVLGPSNVRSTNGKLLSGRFDSHMAGGVLLGMEEVSFQDKAETYESLKALITNDTNEYEQKFKDAETAPTPRGVIILANDPYSLYVPQDDRRFFVISAAEKRHPAESYFDGLWNLGPSQVSDVYHALMKIDLSEFSSNHPPFSTAAKQRMAKNSVPAVDAVVAECIEDEVPPFNKDLARYQDVLEAVKKRHGQYVSNKQLDKALEKSGCVRDSRQCRLAGGSKERFVIIRNHEHYAQTSPTDLAKAYESQNSRSATRRPRPPSGIPDLDGVDLT